MIKNIVFDLGRVLINFEPVEHLRSLGYDEEQALHLNEKIFCSTHWRERDRGTVTREEAYEIFSRDTNLPIGEISAMLGESYQRCLTLKTDTEQLLTQLLDDGYKVYILSNFPEDDFGHVRNKYDFFNHVHGMVISYQVRKIKPEPEIYKYLLDTYGLAPNETVFIDDVRQNIDGAANFGIHTILFTEFDEVKEMLEDLIRLCAV